MTRISVYIDGYNLYHAIHDLRQPHLKWLSLQAMSELLTQHIADADIVNVWYFSAYATWKPDAYKRHRDYVAAIESENTKVVLGNFKKKPNYCKTCKVKWHKHEEKESDVNVALQLLHDASTDVFDQAFVISADTDLSAAIRFVKSTYPQKHLTAVFPPGRHSVGALIKAAGANVRISDKVLRRCLLPSRIGGVARPSSYDPPS